MRVFAIIPVKKFENSKTRLSSVLSLEQRVRLSGLLLKDTLAALAKSKEIEQVIVVSSDRRARYISGLYGAVFIQEESDSGVNSAVMLADRRAKNSGADATVVIPQDLPMLEVAEIDSMCKEAESYAKCIVICPSEWRDGTNVLLRKPPSAIEIHYDNNSYSMHLQSAKESGVEARIYESERLMFDIDKPEDIDALAKIDEDKITSKSATAFLKSLDRTS